MDSEGNALTYPGGPPSVLTVSLAGNGSGTVTGGGISCPGTCSHSYMSGTTATLTATPAVGSTFTGWSGGGCSGTGTCEVTMNTDQNVTATFAASGAGGGGGGTSPGEGRNPSNPSPQQPSTTTPHKKQLKCRKGFKKKKVHGKERCVKVKVHRRR